MAVLEVELVRKSVRFLNKELVKLIPGRLLEAIKGKRKQNSYRNLVKSLSVSMPLDSVLAMSSRDADAPTLDVAVEMGEVGDIEEWSVITDEVVDVNQGLESDDLTRGTEEVVSEVIGGQDLDDTLIIGMIPYYLDLLYGNNSLRSPAKKDEISLFGVALMETYCDLQKVKICMAYMKKLLHIERLFTQNSVSSDLNSEIMFEHWSHLFTHTGLVSCGLLNNYSKSSISAEKLSHLIHFVMVDEISANYPLACTSM